MRSQNPLGSDKTPLLTSAKWATVPGIPVNEGVPSTVPKSHFSARFSECSTSHYSPAGRHYYFYPHHKYSLDRWRISIFGGKARCNLWRRRVNYLTKTSDGRVNVRSAGDNMELIFPTREAWLMLHFLSKARVVQMSMSDFGPNTMCIYACLAFLNCPPSLLLSCRTTHHCCWKLLLEGSGKDSEFFKEGWWGGWEVRVP